MSESEISPEKAKRLLEADKDYIYLDVRTVGEFEAGRPSGAINIPIAEINPTTGQMDYNPQFLHVVHVRIPRGAKVIVGCKSGGRSASACELMRGEGYANVVNLVGGFGGVQGPGGYTIEAGWATLGYPIETGDAGERSYKSLSETPKPG